MQKRLGGSKRQSNHEIIAITTCILRLDGGIHWQSGKSGPLQHATKHSAASTALQSRNLQHKKPVKVKVLKDQNTSKQGSEVKSGLPPCGQCERVSALLVSAVLCDAWGWYYCNYCYRVVWSALRTIVSSASPRSTRRVV